MSQIDLQELMMAHFNNPFQGSSTIDKVAGRAIVENINCGDKVDFSFSTVLLDLRRKNEDIVTSSAIDLKPKQHIHDICYNSKGCYITRSFSSLLFEEIYKTQLVEVQAKLDYVDNLLAFFPELNSTPNTELLNNSNSLLALRELLKKIPMRADCALLPWRAVREAFEHFDFKPK
jgi:NifU-like protein involved in Fe-S cluster formation